MSTTTIEDLSPEILVEIFSYCIASHGHLAFQTNVVPVCKTWLSLSWAPSLRKKIYVTTGHNSGSVMSWKYALSLSNRGLIHYTKSLVAYGWPSDDPLLPLAVLANIRDLKWLEIVECNITRNAMIILPKVVPNLKSLYLVESSFDESQPLTLEALGPILTQCGSKLKLFGILRCETDVSEELITEVAARCPSLEVFHWCNTSDMPNEIPIYKLASGCPRLRELYIPYCSFSTAGENDCSGFKELRRFMTEECDFHGLDVCSLLKNSNNLTFLQLDQNYNLVLSDFSKIPSKKLRFLQIEPLEDNDVHFAALKQAVHKWKRTLLHLKISLWRRDVTCVLKILLHSNPRLKLEELEIYNVDRGFLKIFIEKCVTLERLRYASICKVCQNREQIMQLRDTL